MARYSDFSPGMPSRYIHQTFMKEGPPVNPVPPDLAHYFEDIPPQVEMWTDAEGKVWFGPRPKRTHSIEKKVTIELLQRVTLKKILPSLIHDVRNDENFFEYVEGDPATAGLELSFEIEYLKGERRKWDEINDPNFRYGLYLICIFTFELPPL